MLAHERTRSHSGPLVLIARDRPEGRGLESFTEESGRRGEEEMMGMLQLVCFIETWEKNQTDKKGCASCSHN